MIKLALPRWKEGTIEQIVSRLDRIVDNIEEFKSKKINPATIVARILKNYTGPNEKKIMENLFIKYKDSKNKVAEPLKKFYKLQQKLTDYSTVNKIDEYKDKLNSLGKKLDNKKELGMYYANGYNIPDKYYNYFKKVIDPTFGEQNNNPEFFNSLNLNLFKDLHNNAQHILYDFGKDDSKIFQKLKSVSPQTINDVSNKIFTRNELRNKKNFLDSIDFIERAKKIQLPQNEIEEFLTRTYKYESGFDVFKQNGLFKDLYNKAKNKFIELENRWDEVKFLKDHPEYKHKVHDENITVDEALTEIRGKNLSALSENPKWIDSTGKAVCISGKTHGAQYGLGKNYIDSVLNGNAKIYEYINPKNIEDRVLIFANKNGDILEYKGPGSSDYQLNKDFFNSIKKHNLRLI